MANEELAQLVLEHSYLTRRPDEEPFTLASGIKSYHYFDCERTTTFAPALPIIARAFYEELLPSVECVGGPTRGADPIADCIAYYSVLQNRPINVFSVRKEEKEHGITGWVEGSAHAGDKVAFVDDVVTSGKSVVESLGRCRNAGLEVVQILVLVDRGEHEGIQRIRDAAGSIVPVKAIFTYRELLAYRETTSRRPDTAVSRQYSAAI